MNECIITQTLICPHSEISGKICSACKLPDSNCKFCGGTDYKHYLNCPSWKYLIEREKRLLDS